MITLSRYDIQSMLDKAAEDGARRALKDIGLHDENAGRDVLDLRDMIQGWRFLRRSIFQSIVSKFVNYAMILLLLGGALKLSNMDIKEFQKLFH